MEQNTQFLDTSIFSGPVEEHLREWLQNRRYSRYFIISDQNTHRLCRPLLPLPDAPEFVVGDETETGPMERFKTLHSCEAIWKSMFDAGLDRKSLVINLGGGVVGDMGGFCAATFKRGIDFIQVPTSLLAMTDAAIGGKLGIDFLEIKNAIGVFRNPEAVFIDPKFLKTLPLRELRSGFAEVIKHALIGNPTLWKKIQAIPANSFSTAEASGLIHWKKILNDSIQVKTKIVAEDPYEKGIRALLNFGHTFGHALESYFLQTSRPLLHGEAVAIGMICEMFDQENFKKNKAPETILRFFGHRKIPESAFPKLWELMQHDKKNTSGTVRMAVPEVDVFSMQWCELSQDDVYRRLQFYNELAGTRPPDQ